MSHSVKDIAAALGAEAFGAVDILIDGATEPGLAGPGDLALAMSPKFAEALGAGRARAAVIWDGADWEALGLEAAIVAPRARLAMARLTSMLDSQAGFTPGIHPSAVIEPGTQIGAGACIGPFVYIGAGAVIGENSRIGSHVSIAPGVEIGADALIHAGGKFCGNVRIGDRFIAQPGVAVGGDGFSFVTATPSAAEQIKGSHGAEAIAVPEDASWHRIHSLGGVEIGDDVEIGANSCVDAGTVRATKIGRGSKIDNLVQIGHNDIIGEDCLICGQTGIAGSVTVGDRTVLGGRVAVADNIEIGADVVCGFGTVVMSRVPAGRVMLGYPAVKMDAQMASIKALRRLPRLAQDVAKLQEAVSKRGDKD